METIKFSKEEKEDIVRNIQLYLTQELSQELGKFDAEFLLDFFSEELGAYYYNRGLYDAQAILEKRIVSVTEAIYEIEKPTRFKR